MPWPRPSRRSLKTAHPWPGPWLVDTGRRGVFRVVPTTSRASWVVPSVPLVSSVPSVVASLFLPGPGWPAPQFEPAWGGAIAGMMRVLCCRQSAETQGAGTRKSHQHGGQLSHTRRACWRPGLRPPLRECVGL